MGPFGPFSPITGLTHIAVVKCNCLNNLANLCECRNFNACYALLMHQVEFAVGLHTFSHGVGVE